MQISSAPSSRRSLEVTPQVHPLPPFTVLSLQRLGKPTNRRWGAAMRKLVTKSSILPLDTLPRGSFETLVSTAHSLPQAVCLSLPDLPSLPPTFLSTEFILPYVFVLHPVDLCSIYSIYLWYFPLAYGPRALVAPSLRRFSLIHPLVIYLSPSFLGLSGIHSSPNPDSVAFYLSFVSILLALIQDACASFSLVTFGINEI